MPENIIGILAGMGPRSTAPFIDLVIDECQRQYGAQNDIDFPSMMIYSLPAPCYVDAAVIACTDIKPIPLPVTVLDAGQLLAEETVKTWLSLK